MAGDPTKKASRRGFKSVLTRRINEVKRAIALVKPEEVENSIPNLEKTYEDFTKAHDAFHEDLTDPNEIEESDNYFEDVSGNYVDSLLFIRKWLDDRIEKSQKVAETKNLKDERKDNVSRDEILNYMNLPKLELEKFDGDPLKYPSFIAAFEEHVERVTEDPRIRLSRLVQCTILKARDAIRSCSLIKGEKGYTEAREILRRRFGDDNLIVSRMLGDLKSGKFVQTSEELQQFADELSTCHEVLSSLQKLNEVDTQSSIQEIARRLTPDIRTRWWRLAMDKKNEKNEYPNFSEFVKFVVKETSYRTDPVWGSFSSRPRWQNPSKSSSKESDQKKSPSSSTSSYGTSSSSSSSAFVSNAKPQRPIPPCVLCDGAHRLYACDTFKKMKPDERLKLVTSKELCENCFLSNHTTADCRRPNVCTVVRDGVQCGQRHSKFIHVDKKPAQVTSGEKTAKNNNASIDSNQASGNTNVVLPVVEVTVNDAQGTCALLDTGSTNSFCTERLVDLLGIKGHDVSYSLSTLTASHDVKKTKLVNLKLTSNDGKTSLAMSNVYVVKDIPVNVATCDDVHEYTHLYDLPVPKLCSQVDVLIGQDHSEALLPLETRCGKKHDPFAVRTLLGWSVNGPVSRSVCKDVITNFVNASEVSLNDSIEAMWNIESDNVQCKSVTWSNDDKRVVKLWDDNVKVVNGHYELPIPWKPDIAFTNNLPQAMARLTSTMKSIEKRGLRAKYDSEMSKVLDKGYAEIIQPDLSENKVWYLPHHAVLNPKKPDKLRVVFDCAAKHAGLSLNDRCYQGPDFNNRLIDVMLRFRQHQYAVMGDIEAMYHQVKIPIYDRDALRFLWFDGAGNIIHCRMTSHLF